MAGPLSGVLGAQQQVSLASQANGQQSQQNAQGVREQREEREPQPNEVQAQGAPAAETNNTETNQDFLRAQQEDLLNVAANDPEQAANTPRGSIVDIAV